MEGLTHKLVAKIAAWTALVLLAGGLWYYAGTFPNEEWGLYAAALGGILLLLAIVLGRNEILNFFMRRSARMGMSALAGIVVALAVALVLGSLAIRHSWQADLTEDSRYTLAPQTIEIMKKLEQPVKGYIFMPDGQPGRTELGDLLGQYAYLNPNFSYDFVDPNREPGIAKRFGVRTYGTIALECADKHELITMPGEQEITNAFLKLLRPDQKAVYFLTGHGERSIDDTEENGLSKLKEEVAKQNYKVEPWLITSAKAIPDDASALILAAPVKELLPAEIEVLNDYLRQGGGLVVLTELEARGGLTPWLENMGIILDEDLILDETSQMVGASPLWPFAIEYGDHEITRPLKGTLCYFPLASSLRLADMLPPGVSGEFLVKSSPNAWGITDLEMLKQDEITLDPAVNLKGPFDLGLVLNLPSPADAEPKEGETTPRGGRLVVFGDTDFVSNSHLTQAGNQDLILNSISFLAEEQDLISIRPKAGKNEPVYLQAMEGHLIFWVPTVILPLLFVILGIAVIVRRRSVLDKGGA